MMILDQICLDFLSLKTKVTLYQVSARVNQELITRATQFGLILDDISITHLTFGR